MDACKNDFPSVAVNSPSILINPVNVLGVAIGDEVAFVVVAKGNRLSYLWEYGDGSPLPDDPRYDGKETTILTIFNLILEDSGLYRCRISNTAGLVYSQPAQLTVGTL